MSQLRPCPDTDGTDAKGNKMKKKLEYEITHCCQCIYSCGAFNDCMHPTKMIDKLHGTKFSDEDNKKDFPDWCPLGDTE
jgi:hypothetical protein